MLIMDSVMQPECRASAIRTISCVQVLFMSLTLSEVDNCFSIYWRRRAVQDNLVASSQLQHPYSSIQYPDVILPVASSST